MENKKYYVAYGSNLAVEQMAKRCPDARVVGTAILNGWALLFKRHATIERIPTRKTPVLVWGISEQDEEALDASESFPSYYYKKDLEVEVFPTEGGNTMRVTAMVYIMQEYHDLSMPSPYYYRVISDSYKALHFPMHVLKQALVDSTDKEAAEDFLGKWGL